MVESSRAATRDSLLGFGWKTTLTLTYHCKQPSILPFLLHRLFSLSSIFIIIFYLFCYLLRFLLFFFVFSTWECACIVSIGTRARITWPTNTQQIFLSEANGLWWARNDNVAQQQHTTGEMDAAKKSEKTHSNESNNRQKKENEQRDGLRSTRWRRSGHELWRKWIYTTADS